MICFKESFMFHLRWVDLESREGFEPPLCRFEYVALPVELPTYCLSQCLAVRPDFDLADNTECYVRKEGLSGCGCVEQESNLCDSPFQSSALSAWLSHLG